MDKKKNDTGDWLFLLFMGGLVIGYYLYENPEWLSTMKTTAAPARIAGSTLFDHWGLAFLILALIVAGLWIVGDSLNRRTVESTTEKARRSQHGRVIGRNKIRKVL